MKVLITGGSGLIGKHLCEKLKSKGYEVALLGRSKNDNSPYLTYVWNVDKYEIDVNALVDTDYIIHLAGANIGEKRWTKSRKSEIIISRIKSADLIHNNIDKANNLKAFISASAIGYYGAVTSENIFNENDEVANDFLGQTCLLWENAANKFEAFGIRTVKIRTGVVFSKSNGALEKIIKPIKMNIGSPLGSGNQYIPWIHIDDLCEIYIKSIEDKKMNGSFNAVSPENITNSELTILISNKLKKKIWLPNIPSFILKLLFGNMSDLILKGSRVSSEKIMNAGFNFKFSKIDVALNDLFN